MHVLKDLAICLTFMILLYSKAYRKVYNYFGRGTLYLINKIVPEKKIPFKQVKSKEEDRPPSPNSPYVPLEAYRGESTCLTKVTKAIKTNNFVYFLGMLYFQIEKREKINLLFIVLYLISLGSIQDSLLSRFSPGGTFSPPISLLSKKGHNFPLSRFPPEGRKNTSWSF